MLLVLTKCTQSAVFSPSAPRAGVKCSVKSTLKCVHSLHIFCCYCTAIIRDIDISHMHLNDKMNNSCVCIIATTEWETQCGSSGEREKDRKMHICAFVDRHYHKNIVQIVIYCCEQTASSSNKKRHTKNYIILFALAIATADRRRKKMKSSSEKKKNMCMKCIDTTIYIKYIEFTFNFNEKLRQYPIVC